LCRRLFDLSLCSDPAGTTTEARTSPLNICTLWACLSEKCRGLSSVFDVNPAPDRNPHIETAIVEGGKHDRSIKLALEAALYFEVDEADACASSEKAAQQTLIEWCEALRQIGLAGAQAREYEAAFMNDQTELAQNL